MVNAGARFSLGPGCSINCNGAFIVNGTADKPVIFGPFNQAPAPGCWGSIVFNAANAMGSSLNYAFVNYGKQIDVLSANSVGIYNCSIMNYSGHAINVSNSSNFTAQGNTIASTNVNHGIVIAGGSNNNCYGNTVYKIDHNQRGVGIYYSGSSGHIARNDVSGFSWGIGANYGASPDSKGAATNKNGQVTNTV